MNGFAMARELRLGFLRADRFSADQSEVIVASLEKALKAWSVGGAEASEVEGEGDAFREHGISKVRKRGRQKNVQASRLLKGVLEGGFLFSEDEAMRKA